MKKFSDKIDKGVFTVFTVDNLKVKRKRIELKSVERNDNSIILVANGESVYIQRIRTERSRLLGLYYLSEEEAKKALLKKVKKIKKYCVELIKDCDKILEEK